MATHSSVLTWRIPGTGEPCGLPSMGLHRVGLDWSDSAAAAGLEDKSWVWWSGDPIHAVTLSLISYMTYVVFFNCKMGLVYNLPWRVPVWNQWDTYKMLRCGQKVWQLCSKFTKRLLLWNHWEYIKPLFWRAVCVWGKILGSNSWIFMGLKQKCHFVFRSLKSVWQELHLQMAILAQGGFLPIVVKQAGLIETAPCRNHDISAFV